MQSSWQTKISAESGKESNNRKRILLVTIDWSREMSQTPMLGPTLLIANSRRDQKIRSNVDFEIRQFSTEHPTEEIIEEVLANKYDAIGFSCYVWNYSILQQVIPIIKQVHPETLIIVGGPELLEQEEEIMQRIPAIDVIVYKDGEIAFIDLLHQIISGKNDWASVRGILARKNGDFIDTYLQRKSLRYEDTASPYLEGIITGEHSNLFMITYRGCPGRCAYCAWCGNEMNKLELLPMERVKKELDLITQMGAKSIGIFDSNFNHPPERASQIFDLILEYDQINLVGNHLYAQSVKQDLVQKMSKVNTIVGVGLQTTDPDTNKLMKRQLHIDKMSGGIQLIKQHDINFVLQMIIGLPGDTYDSIASTLNYAMRFRPPKIDAFRLMILPGTEYRRRADEFDIIYEPHPDYHIISHHSMNASEINRAERMAQALTIFYNQPKTREAMYRMARENNESIVQFADAIGKFIQTFNLLDKKELRKGDIVRAQDEIYLLNVLSDFERFRKELLSKSKSQMVV